MGNDGRKRTRAERVAALVLPPRSWRRAWGNLRRRDVLLRLGLSVLAAVVLCAVIRGWEPPFVYRAGDVPQHDVVVRAAFSSPESTDGSDDCISQ